MEIIILGESKDNKGTELEKLCKRLFEKLGFDKSALNVVKSGANEYDVIAKSNRIINGENITIPIFAECKAHSRKCDMPDFLKFLGKLYCQKKENPNTEGYFVALSGVNGNFLGAYDSLRNIDDSIHLIVEEDLIKFLQVDYSLSDVFTVRTKVSQFTNRVIDSIDLSLYDNKIFWVIRFNSKDYTILSSDSEPITKESVLKIHELLLSYGYYNFIDLTEERERQIRLAYVRGVILCFALNEKAKDKDMVTQMLTNTGIPIEEFELIWRSKLDYVSDEYPLKIQNISSKVQFFVYLLSNYVFVETITSPFYQLLIDNDFIKEICDIQGGLTLTDKEKEQVIRLLKVSHSAIINAVNPNKFIINSLKNANHLDIQKKEKVRELCVTKLMGMLIEGANDDFGTQQYSKILHCLGIQQYELLQRVIINAGKDNEFHIESNPKIIIAPVENLPGNPVISVLSFNNDSETTPQE